MLRNLLKYLLFVVVIGVLSILYNTYYMSIIFLTVVAIPFFMFAVLCYVYGKVRAEFVSATHIVNKGEKIPITVLLHNPTIFPISNIKVYLSYTNSFSKKKYLKEEIISVDARTKTQLTFQLVSEYAGNLVISLKGIRVYDYLKLFSLKRKQKGFINAAVLPFYYELPENYISGNRSILVESDHYSTNKSGDDPSEVFAIREYREGDRLQRIHWKLSRKQGQLMIKEFSEPMNCAVLLLVNLYVPSGVKVLSFLDAVLECALTLSFTFLTQGQVHFLAWYDAKCGFCRRIRVTNEKDFYEAVDGLLQTESQSGDVDAVTEYMAEHPNEQHTDLFYVTGEAKAGGMESLALISALTKHIIYINELDEISKTKGITKYLSDETLSSGVEIWPVSIKNMKRDLEQVKVS